MKSNFVLLLFAAVLVPNLTACTRASKTTNARFSISLPSTAQKGASAFSGQLMHVAINVTGPGISNPIIFSWDAHQNGIARQAPDGFEFEVPAGERRLIQALAVYENAATQGMIFSYGDLTTNLPGGNFAVSIDVAEVGSGSLVSGRVAGRYLTAADSGPTGVVDVRFNPGGGKPPLIIEKSFIANGWFAFFILAGANLEYTVNGTQLFGGPVDLNSPVFVPSAANGNLTRVARASLPSMVRMEGGGSTKLHEQPAIYTWGFWSNDSSLLSGKSVCNDLSSGGAFTRIYRYATVPADANTLLVLNNSPNADQSFPSIAALLATTPGLANVFAGGGVTPTCSGLNASSIPIKKSLIDGNGGDSVAGFRNIFLFTSDNSPFTISGTGTTASISGIVLPGIPSIYSRIRFYKRVGTAGEEFRIETPMCQAIANGASGFIYAGEASSINSSTGAFSASNVGIDTTSTDYMDGKISLVACGASGPAVSDLAPVGLFQPLYNYGSSGPYLRLELTGANFSGNNYAATNGQCYPLALKLYVSSGGGATPYYVSSPVTISGLNPGGGAWYEIHDTAGCTHQIAANSSATISTGSSYGSNLWIKPISVGADLIFSGVTASGDGVSFSPNSNKVNVGNPSLLLTGPSSAILWSAANRLCYEVKAIRLDSAGMPMMSDSTPLNVTFTGTGFTLYPDLSNCQNSSSPLTSSFSIPANQSMTTMYMQLTTAGMRTLSTPVTGLYPAASYSVSALAEDATHSALPSRFLLTALSQKAGLCNTLKITHVNSAGDEIPVLTPTNVKLSVNTANVLFFNNPSCSSPVLTDSSVYFSAHQSSALVYFMPLSSPGSNFIVSGSTGAISGDSASLVVTTPPAAEEPYMIYSIPPVKSILLGSHDFTVAKTIVFAPSPGATLSCEMASPPSFTSWTPCTGQLSGDVFTWSATDATAGTGFRFNLSAPSKPYRSYSFIPRQIYRRHGVDFQVLNCGTTLSPNGTTDFADINTAMGSHSVVCLEAGTFTQPTTPPAIAPGSSKTLLGKTDPATGNPTTILQAVAAYDLATVANPGPTFANLDLRAAGSGANKYLVNIEGGSGTPFNSYNNNYQVNSAHTMGIRAHGDQGFNSFGDSFVVDGTAFSTFGIMSTNCVTCTDSSIKSPLFRLSSHASNGTPFATAIRLWTSSANVQIFDAKIDPAYNQGSFLVIDNSGSQNANVTVTKSAFSLSGFGDNLNRFPIYIAREASLTLDGVRIENSMNSDLIRAVETWAANNMNLTINDSRLVNLVDQRVMFVNTSYAQNLSTARTHFIRAGAAGATSPAVQSGSAITWNLNGPVLASPNTYLCGTTAGTNFSSVATTAPTYTGSYSAPVITNNANATHMSCQ